MDHVIEHIWTAAPHWATLVAKVYVVGVLVVVAAWCWFGFGRSTAKPVYNGDRLTSDAKLGPPPDPPPTSEGQ